MPTNQQRREAAKRKLERQQQRREEQARRRRKIAAIASVVVVVAVLAAVVVIVTISRSAGAGCQYLPDTVQPAARPVTAPANTSPPREGIVGVTLATNQGVIPLALDRSKAPCTVESFVSLARAGYYNGTPCHRLSTEATLKLLQCGDPTGTGAGSPGYFVPDEKPAGLAPAPTGGAIYPKATVAMAKRALPNSGGSQFFLVYADTTLPPDYTIFGTIGEPGLPVLEKVAAAGDDRSNTAGGGKPNLPVTIESIAVS